jgi:hypothetical protein
VGPGRRSAPRGFAPTHGIKDYDLGYFDPDDLTDAWEAAAQQRFEQSRTAPVHHCLEGWRLQDQW